VGFDHIALDDVIVLGRFARLELLQAVLAADDRCRNDLLPRASSAFCVKSKDTVSFGAPSTRFISTSAARMRSAGLALSSRTNARSIWPQSTRLSAIKA
jgi:hypothetical protein